jgi:hypothetical protein
MRDFTTDLKQKPKPPGRRWRRVFILLGCATFVLAIVGVGYAVATAFDAMFVALSAIGTAIVAAVAVLSVGLIVLLGIAQAASVNPLDALVLVIIIVWDLTPILNAIMRLFGRS